MFFAIIKAFIAGFVATLSFHQGVVWGLDQLRLVDAPAWRMAPVAVTGLPSVISLALWGGVWGIALWLAIRRALAAGYYVGAAMLGAILPSLVSFTLVAWLKDKPLAADFQSRVIAAVLIINGAWGLGVAVFMRLMQPPR